jgi:hypothetical protein
VKQSANRMTGREEGVQVVRRCAGGGKREGSLVENDMSGEQQVVRVQIETPIPLVLRRVPKKDTDRSEGRAYGEQW